jgi:O-antigen/teichoic acid export membrane protein
MSPLLFFKSLGFGWAAFLVATGRQNQRLVPQVVSAVLNVGLNLWLIPRLGIPGVALIYMVSEIVLTIGYGFLVYRGFNPVKLRPKEP